MAEATPLNRRGWLQAGLASAASPWLAACASLGGPPQPWRADGSAPGQAPLGEVQTSAAVLRRISVGSCADESQPQPVWDALLADVPGLHLFGGDNVYASEQPWRAETLRTLYATAAAIPNFARLRATLPHLATWDDHDYGLNDGGADFPHRQASKAEFLRFWQVPAGDERQQREGIYHARRFGPPGRCVQVIMLDTRWFRSPWQPTDQRDAPGKQRYVPSTDTRRTMLGPAQWAWLAEQLAQPADVRLIVSGIQVLAEGHGFEHWGLFPHEQQRLLDLIGTRRARGVLLVSGDRHIGAVYRRSRGAPYPLTELTSSGLTHAWAKADETGPNRLGELVRENHYALIDIDWDSRSLGLGLKSVQGQWLQRHGLRLDELQAP